MSWPLDLWYGAVGFMRCFGSRPHPAAHRICSLLMLVELLINLQKVDSTSARLGALPVHRAVVRSHSFQTV
jgi:hypothetical protein